MKRILIREPLWFAVSLAIPVITGLISGALTKNAMVQYASFQKPPLSPPGWLFPVVWTILYLMMGLASYFIITAETDGMRNVTALFVYGLQLVFNFVWSIIFFNLGEYLFAFVWLMGMWVLEIVAAILFYRIIRGAGLLLIPYILWTTFAAYLNLATYIMSRTPAPLA